MLDQFITIRIQVENVITSNTNLTGISKLAPNKSTSNSMKINTFVDDYRTKKYIIRERKYDSYIYFFPPSSKFTGVKYSAAAFIMIFTTLRLPVYKI